jgi:hypothetical protein
MGMALVVLALACAGRVGATELDTKLQRRIRGIPTLEKVVVLFDKEAIFEKTSYEALVVVTVNSRFSRLGDEAAAGVELRVRGAVAGLLPKKKGLVLFRDGRGKVVRAVAF